MEMMSPRSTLHFMRAAFSVLGRRMVKGPRRPGWSLAFETLVRFMRIDQEYASTLPPAEQRRHSERLPPPPSEAPKKVRREPADAGGVPGEWFTPAAGASTDAVVLYLHGGAYVYGSTRTHGELIARLALAAGARVLAINYRLAPEHPFPAAVDDAKAAYRWLLKTAVPAGKVVLAGDSAGGGLAVTAMLALRDAGEPLPAGGVLLSPWVDLENTGDSLVSNEPYDWGDKAMLDGWARLFTPGENLRHPLVSPTHADLKGLPPLFVQVGTAELVRDPVLAFVDKARAAGVQVECDVWPEMVHLFQSFGPMFEQSRRAVEKLGQAARALTERGGSQARSAG